MTAYINNTLQDQILRGELWTGNLSGQLNPGNAKVILISVGASEVVFSPSVSPSGAVSLALKEGVTTSADGVAITNYNMYRSSPTSLLTTTFSGPTITVAGTPVSTSRVAGSGYVNESTAFNADNGMVLQASTKYSFTLTVSDSAAVSYTIAWFLREL